MAFTVVSFHAHPDDEALLTGGTLARAAAEGHRVVLVTATDGAAGLTSARVHAAGDLSATRLAELERSAQALGVARIVPLGYPDGRFSAAGVQEPAHRLAALLREERADLLTGYDANGGYGHPDHVHVHHVARLAARLAETPRLLEATVDRRLLLRAARVTLLIPGTPRIDLRALAGSYTDPASITHRIDVREQLAAKLAALAAHHSQAVGRPDGAAGRRRGRTVGLLTGLPPWLARPVLGREWFVAPGQPVPERPYPGLFQPQATRSSSGSSTAGGTDSATDGSASKTKRR